MVRAVIDWAGDFGKELVEAPGTAIDTAVRTLDVVQMITACDDVNWTMVVDILGMSAKNNLLVILIPQPGEVLEEYLQPRYSRERKKGNRSKSGRRKKTKSGRKRWAASMLIPDVDGLVASVLPGRSYFASKVAGGATKFLIKGFNAFELANFALMMVEISNDFVVEAQTGLMNANFCQIDNNRAFSAVTAQLGGGRSFVGLNYASVISEILNQDGLAPNGIGRMVSEDGLPMDVTYACNVTMDLTIAGFSDANYGLTIYPYNNGVQLPLIEIPNGTLSNTGGDLQTSTVGIVGSAEIPHCDQVFIRAGAMLDTGSVRAYNLHSGGSWTYIGQTV